MEKNTTVAIIGHGFVGTATEFFLRRAFKEEFYIGVHDPAEGIEITDWSGIDYAFI